MKRPMFAVALLFATGIALAAKIDIPLLWLFPCAFTASILTLALPSWTARLLPLSLLLAGWTNMASRSAALSPRDLRNIADDNPRQVTLRGRLFETPALRLYQHDAQESLRTLARIDIDALRRRTDWEPASGRVAITTPGLLAPGFFRGQSVEVSGVLHIPPRAVAPGLFDYRKHLWALGICYQLKTNSTNDWNILPGHSKTRPPFTDRFTAWAQTTLARGLPAEDESLRLLWAMSLGWKTGLTDEVSEPFMRTGTLHVFAISGLHIALISAILIALLRVLQLPRPVCGWLVIPFLWFYTLATGWQASAIRSTVMMSVVIAGWSLRRPSDLLNSLAAAALLILTWDPRQLFQTGFQLSFCVLLSIGLFRPVLDQLSRRLLAHDPLLPPELRPRWRQYLDRPLQYLAAGLVTSLAAWLGSLPLIAIYFHLVTPVSLISNLVIVPLSGWALTSTLGSLICGSWLPCFTELFNHSSWFIMFMMVAFSKWAASWPAAFFYVPAPNLIQITLYYLLLAGLLSGWLLAPSRRLWTASALLLLLLGWLTMKIARNPTTTLTILPAAGNVIFARHAGQRPLLIDCGNPSSAQFIVAPFLHAQGLNRLPWLLLTHGDQNHVGGAAPLQQQFEIDHTILSSARFRSPAYRKFAANLSRTPDKFQILYPGDHILGWTILHPAETDRFPQADDQAIVLFANFNGTRVLALSDLGQNGQYRLMERHPNLQADLVLAGLPTQGEPLSNPLLTTLKPKLVILLSAEFPASERPKMKLRARLHHSNVPVLYVCDTGTIVVRCQQGYFTIDGIEVPNNTHTE